MSHSTTSPRHPLLACADTIEKALASVLDCDPAYLDTNSEVLDLGRTSRLFTPAQRRALALKHPRFRAQHCTVPAPWCEAHHAVPWSQDGNTDRKDGVLLCHWHHHSAHDTRYTTTRMPGGNLRYHRRT